VDGDEVLDIVVEIPKGSRNKYEYDHETGAIVLDRMLFTSVQYPTRLRVHRPNGRRRRGSAGRPRVRRGADLPWVPHPGATGRPVPHDR